MASFSAFTPAVVLLVLSTSTLGLPPNTPPSPPSGVRPPSPQSTPTRNLPNPGQPSPNKPSLPYGPQGGPYSSGLPQVPGTGANRQNPQPAAPFVPYSGRQSQLPYGGGPAYGNVQPAGRPQEVEKDELDQYFATIDRVARQLDVGAEIIANGDSQESRAKKRLDKILTFTVSDVSERNILQYQRLESLEQQLTAIEQATRTLAQKLDQLEALNAANAANISALDKTLADVQLRDSDQVRSIANLLTAAQSLSPELLTIVENAFTLLTNKTKAVIGQINATNSLVDTRGCEVGVVTLSADERWAVVTFNTDFRKVVPQLVYSIVGIRNKFENKHEPAPGYPQYGYGQPRSPPYANVRQPSTVGAIVKALATPSAMTIQLVDTSFNGAELQTVDVSWEACSFSPGPGFFRSDPSSQ